MSVDYNGQTCRFDRRTNTYSRPPVSIKYPCSTCGSNRPIIPGTLRPGVCCKRQKVDKPQSTGHKQEESKCNLN